MSESRYPNRYWGNKTPPKVKAEFFNAVTTPGSTGDGTLATIRMYGPIDSWGGYWGISTKDVGQVLDALDESVTQVVLRINSPGGEVTEAVAILNMLRAHKASVTAVVDGLAASAASVIAAGCDETVMSPGTQMMIHSPSSIAWGNAVEMRKTADTLDSFESAMTEVYSGKAGERDWAALLVEETWLTASETVSLGLADRVAVIPDAGEAATLGEDELVVITTDDNPEGTAPVHLLHPAARTLAPAATRPPDSTEPGNPTQKEVAVSDTIKAGLRERLGVTDANASDETLLAALDQTLQEQAAPAIVDTLPEGAVVVDAAALEDLQVAAAAGVAAREEQNRQRRDAIITTALQEGRIAPAARQTWRDQLDKDEDGTTALLTSMPKNTIPVTEIGEAGPEASADDALYGAIYGTPKGA